MILVFLTRIIGSNDLFDIDEFLKNINTEMLDNFTYEPNIRNFLTDKSGNDNEYSNLKSDIDFQDLINVSTFENEMDVSTFENEMDVSTFENEMDFQFDLSYLDTFETQYQSDIKQDSINMNIESNHENIESNHENINETSIINETSEVSNFGPLNIEKYKPILKNISKKSEKILTCEYTFDISNLQDIKEFDSYQECIKSLDLDLLKINIQDCKKIINILSEYNSINMKSIIKNIIFLIECLEFIDSCMYQANDKNLTNYHYILSKEKIDKVFDHIPIFGISSEASINCIKLIKDRKTSLLVDNLFSNIMLDLTKFRKSITKVYENIENIIRIMILKTIKRNK